MNGKNLFEITMRRIGSKSIVLILTCLLSACDVNHGNVQNNDNVTSEQPAVVVQIDSALVSRAYPMTNASVGPFRIGEVIRDTMDGFEVEKSIESKTVSEGVTIEMPIYTYYIGNEGWVRITPQYDTSTRQVSDKIGEIYVYSELFMTDKSIGATASLRQFAHTYPDLYIRYVYEDDMFAVVTPQLPDVQFLLGREHYTGREQDLRAASNSELNIRDFEENSYFDAIRICCGTSTYNADDCIGIRDSLRKAIDG
ncbi:MAG: hypothetical protein NC248_00055 [Bacteroides sp.]|nr:hypothetical protein [Bacteroides sp.]MCM1391092.1 hypothetical protein [Bacteroides sp.]